MLLAALGGQFHQPADERRLGKIKGLDQQFVAGAKLAAMIDEDFSESIETRVVHKESSDSQHRMNLVGPLNMQMRDEG